MKTIISDLSRSALYEEELDSLIKDALVGSSRRSKRESATDDQRIYASLLQRAQTEVIQLPAVDGESGTGEARPESPNALAYARYASRTSDSAVPYNFSSQVAYYRSLVEMKMWCSVGILKLLGNSL